MKTLLKIFTNPVGVAISLVHWLIVTLAFLTQDNPLAFGKKICLHCDYTLFNWLINLNYPSFAIIELLAPPTYILFGKILLIEIILGFILVFLITFQWLLIGFIVSRIANVFKSKQVELSLK